MNRRQFLKSSAAGVVLSATPFLSHACSSNPKKLDKIGLQLYSVRRQMSEDFEGTITKVAEAGYDQVEFAGYYDREPKEIKALLDKLGLVAPAAHTGYRLLSENLEETIEAAKIIGHEYLILPSLPRVRSAQRQPRPAGEQRRQRRQPPVYTLDKTREFVDIFNRIGESCQKADLSFAFHNHQVEFQKIEGTGEVMYDIFLKETDPSLVDFQMDLGWVAVADVDPLTYFKKYPGRFKLFHVKDMNEENQSVVLGKGNLDFAAIFAKSKEAGVKYYIVEYEGEEDPIGSVAASLEYIKNITF